VFARASQLSQHFFFHAGAIFEHSVDDAQPVGLVLGDGSGNFVI
jgi:hypothetical protein